MVYLGENTEGVGMGKIYPLHALVNIADKAFDSHLGGSFSHRWEAKAHLSWWPLDSLRGKIGEKAGCLSQGSI